MLKKVVYYSSYVRETKELRNKTETNCYSIFLHTLPMLTTVQNYIQLSIALEFANGLFYFPSLIRIKLFIKISFLV